MSPIYITCLALCGATLAFPANNEETMHTWMRQWPMVKAIEEGAIEPVQRAWYRLTDGAPKDLQPIENREMPIEKSLNKREAPIDEQNTEIFKRGTPIDRHDTAVNKKEAPIDNHEIALDKKEAPIDKHGIIMNKRGTPIDVTIMDKRDTPLDKLETTIDKRDTPKDDTAKDKIQTPTEKQEKPRYKRDTPKDKLSFFAKRVEDLFNRLIPNDRMVQDLMGYVSSAHKPNMKP